MEHHFEVTGMKCGSCVGKLTKALEDVPGVERASVRLDPPEAVVEMAVHVPAATLSEAARRAGSFSLEEKATRAVSESTASESPEPGSLAPLGVVVAYIAGGVLVRALVSGDFGSHTLMANFMGAFFVVFSLFKMINLSAFADGYATYDILASRSRAYALAYPFIELTLGVSYLVGFAPVLTNVVTAALMTIGSIGVAKALREKRAIRCACLGTALRLPMTKVTLVEDVAMGAMAVGMLLL